MTDDIIIPTMLKSENPLGCLLVVTYYGFKSPIRNACQAFANKKKWIVVEFPMFRFRNDVHDKTENYIDMFCESVQKNSPDAILFWYHCLTAQEMELMQRAISQSIPFLLFNWDDPFSWYDKYGHLPQIAKYFDIALTSSRQCVEKYTNEMMKCESRRKKFPNPIARYCLPGFDEKLTEKKLLEFGDEKIVCDVLFVTTNLYENEQQYNRQRVNRAKIVDGLYALHEAKTIVFHIYGPEFLAKRYPLSYQGYCDYEKQYEINLTARYILSTHVVCEQGYCNERVCVALGCGSLVISDIANPDIYQTTQNDFTEKICVYDLGDTVEIALKNIVELVKKPQKECLTVRNQNRKIAKIYLSWTVWSQILCETLDALSVVPNAANAEKVLKSFAINNTDVMLANDVPLANNGECLMPGEWDTENFVPLSTAEEKEINTTLNTTICAYDKSAPPQLVVPFERQYQLSQIIDKIRNQTDDGDNSALTQFINIIDANPNLNINGVLDFHWHQTDK